MKHTSISLARMDTSRVAKLVGKTARKQFLSCYGMLEHTRWPLYLIGPSGSGKTIMAMNLAKKYSMEQGVPAYYLQLSPDQTKTSIILGLRLINGSLVPVEGVIATAMAEGAIVVVDETTHTMQETLLMFNSIMDPTAVTSIGDKIVYAEPEFRLIFCSNDTQHAGNVRLPQSFAQRVATFRFDYPSRDDEIAVAKRIVASEYMADADVPAALYAYMTAYVREFRTGSYPLSARNIALTAIRCALTPRSEIPADSVDKYFSGQNAESIRRKVYTRIYGKDSVSSDQLNDPVVIDFMRYISEIGVDDFRDIVASCMLVYLDVDGSELNQETQRQKLLGAII